MRLTGVVVAVAIALTAAGCSGGGGTDTITKSEFVAKAKPICAATKKKIDTAQAKLDGSKPGALTNYATFVAKTQLAQVDKLEAIGTFPDDDRRMPRAMGIYKKTFEAWVQDPENSGQSAASKQLVSASRAFTEYGLKDCSLGL